MQCNAMQCVAIHCSFKILIVQLKSDVRALNALSCANFLIENSCNLLSEDNEMTERRPIGMKRNATQHNEMK